MHIQIISLHLALGRQAEQNGELNQASAYLAGAKDRVAELFAYRPEESSHGPFCWVPIGEEEHRKYEKRRKRHLRDLDRHGLQDPRPAIVEDHLTAFLSMSKSWLKDTLVLLDEMDRFFKVSVLFCTAESLFSLTVSIPATIGQHFSRRCFCSPCS